MSEQQPFNQDDFDVSTFSSESYVMKVEKPWGYELLFTPPDLNLEYQFKLLHVNEGEELSTQAHDQKIETQVLVNGKAMRVASNNRGEIEEFEMEKNVSYTNVAGQIHTIKGLEGGADVYEASTPERGVTWRLKDKYKRSDETEEMRKAEREKIANDQS